MNSFAKHPLISIIVPIYKVEKYLKQCLDSIVGQTYRNLEIILIDDGSPDCCPEICDQYGMMDNRIKVIHKSNGGQSSARNIGLDIAIGEYVMFVDSDDYLDTNMVSILADTLIEEDLDIVMCSRYDVGESILIRPLLLDHNVLINNADVMKLILTDTIGSQPWGKIYRLSLFESVRFPEGRVYEDIATTYLAFSKCNRFHYVDKPLYYYRLNLVGTSFTERPNKIIDTFQSFYERLIYAEKHFPNVREECLALAFGTAIGSLNYHIRFGFPEELEKLPKVKKFLYQYYESILKCPQISLLRKLLLRVFLMDESLYNVILRVCIKLKYIK